MHAPTLTEAVEKREKVWSAPTVKRPVGWEVVITAQAFHGSALRNPDFSAWFVPAGKADEQLLPVRIAAFEAKTSVEVAPT